MSYFRSEVDNCNFISLKKAALSDPPTTWYSWRSTTAGFFCFLGDYLISNKLLTLTFELKESNLEFVGGDMFNTFLVAGASVFV